MKFDKAEPEANSKLVMVPLSASDFEQMDFLTNERQVSTVNAGEQAVLAQRAAQHAMFAQDKHEEFCLALEKKHEMQGKKWLFNKDKKCLEFER